MAIKTLIFDWDGTLHDTAHTYGASLRETLKVLESWGYQVPEDRSDEFFSRYLGMNARDMWLDYMPHLPEAVREECSRITGEGTVKQVLSGNARMYEGAEESLRRLKEAGYHMVILSNCKTIYMDAQRKTFGLDRYFDEFYCCSTYDFAPKEQIFPDIASRFSGEYVMIGDRLSDLKVASCHGTHSIGCRYGFGSDEEIAGAERIAENAGQLADLVAELDA